MKTTDEQLLGRWLDGELSPEETALFEARMAASPELQEEAARLRSLTRTLREHASLEREVPHADFFNSQIQERIAQFQESHSPARTQPAPWWAWLRSPWTLTGAAAVLTLGFFLTRTAPPHTEVLSFYAPIQGVQARAFHHTEAGATVLLLDGISAIPADKEVAGIHVKDSANDPTQAVTTLFDDQGRVLLVMTRDARNQPIILNAN